MDLDFISFHSLHLHTFLFLSYLPTLPFNQSFSLLLYSVLIILVYPIHHLSFHYLKISHLSSISYSSSFLPLSQDFSSFYSIFPNHSRSQLIPKPLLVNPTYLTPSRDELFIQGPPQFRIYSINSVGKIRFQLRARASPRFFYLHRDAFFIGFASVKSDAEYENKFILNMWK